MAYDHVCASGVHSSSGVIKRRPARVPFTFSKLAPGPHTAQSGLKQNTRVCHGASFTSWRGPGDGRMGTPARPSDSKSWHNDTCLRAPHTYYTRELFFLSVRLSLSVSLSASLLLLRPSSSTSKGPDLTPEKKPLDVQS